MFSPVTTDTEIVQRIARLEKLFDNNNSHPHFIECVIKRHICLTEEIPYLKLLEPPDRLSISKIWSKINNHSPLSLNIDHFIKEKLTNKKPLPSKVEFCITYIENQICSAQFLKFIAIIPLALLCLLCKIFDLYYIS